MFVFEGSSNLELYVFPNEMNDSIRFILNSLLLLSVPNLVVGVFPSLISFLLLVSLSPLMQFLPSSSPSCQRYAQ